MREMVPALLTFKDINFLISRMLTSELNPGNALDIHSFIHSFILQIYMLPFKPKQVFNKLQYILPKNANL